mgnify:FL=1
MSISFSHCVQTPHFNLFAVSSTLVNCVRILSCFRNCLYIPEKSEDRFIMCMTVSNICVDYIWTEYVNACFQMPNEEKKAGHKSNQNSMMGDIRSNAAKDGGLFADKQKLCKWALIIGVPVVLLVIVIVVVAVVFSQQWVFLSMECNSLMISLISLSCDCQPTTQMWSCSPLNFFFSQRNVFVH